jgi:hypothetical protein
MIITPFAGRWHITEMDMWDEDFFNMDGQSYIQIDDDGGGNFEFGAIQSEIDGKVSGRRFEFSWQGFDEGDQISGWGWVTLKGTDAVVGEILIFQGDNSTFLAKRQ